MNYIKVGSYETTYIVKLEESDINWLLYVMEEYGKKLLFEQYSDNWVDDNCYLNDDLKEMFEKILKGE